MRVTLLAHTPEPERLIASAAKLCYSPVGIDALREGLTDGAAAEFVGMLAELGHESPIEHITFTFGIEGVSRSLLAQLTRHRMASYSVQSQRYVREGAFDYVVPPAIAEDAQALAIFEGAMQQAQQAYDALGERLGQLQAEALEREGLSKKAAARAAGKSAIEDARFVLPNACHTKLICTFNARSLLNFFSLRCCNRAQWEIRALATEMLHLVRAVAPSVFGTAGPPCLRGPCPEGKMTCGKAEQVREHFALR
ncbi:MAG: FAD-dependent thymidylate synthase [Clostridiales bacterium]|nr:FAD-dependent thymidylate synthase [Clostridiales bacterium]